MKAVTHFSQTAGYYIYKRLHFWLAYHCNHAFDFYVLGRPVGVVSEFMFRLYCKGKVMEFNPVKPSV